MLLCCREKANQVQEDRRMEQQHVLSLWFEVCFCVLIFAVTSHNTKNLPSIFQPGVQSFLNR